MYMQEKELPDLRCMCASLRRASRVITSAYDEALRESGLRSTQFSLLQALESSGELTQGELGERLAIDSTTLTRSLRPLIAAGIVASVVGVDRRERRLTLTPKGNDRKRAATVAWNGVQKRLKRRLGDGMWKRLTEDLRAVASVDL
jgi:DNA-binding MarR family transcriptional regulator